MLLTVYSKWIQDFIRETVWLQVALRIVGCGLGMIKKQQQNVVWITLPPKRDIYGRTRMLKNNV